MRQPVKVPLTVQGAVRALPMVLVVLYGVAATLLAARLFRWEPRR